MLAATPGALGGCGVADLVDLLRGLRGGAVLSPALHLSRGARLSHVRPDVDGVRAVQA